jgi:hypothetical protein
VRKLLDSGAIEMRNRILNEVLRLSVWYFLAGCAIAVLWELITPTHFWLSAPGWAKMPLNVATYCLGWLGYLLIGFSVGWLFNVASALRTPTPEKLAEHHAAVENFLFAFIGHALLLSLIIVAIVFLEGQFEAVEKFALDDPPSGFFLGILTGFAEKRVRDFASSMFDRL